jgi:hypothetical protein
MHAIIRHVAPSSKDGGARESPECGYEFQIAGRGNRYEALDRVGKVCDVEGLAG